MKDEDAENSILYEDKKKTIRNSSQYQIFKVLFCLQVVTKIKDSHWKDLV